MTGSGGAQQPNTALQPQAEQAAAAAPAQQPEPRDAPHRHVLEAPQPRLLQVYPLRYTKTIHFIRHGEGFHNIAGRANHDNYKSWEYEDSHLRQALVLLVGTPEGWRQAHELGRHMAAAGIRPQVVIVSPLTRAIETAVGAFGDHPASPAAVANGNGNGSSGGNGNGSSGGNGNGSASASASASAELLMAELSEIPGKRSGHPAVPLGAAPPFVCMELCREHLGVHPCDRYSSLAPKKAFFPGVDFSSVEDADALWQADHRETKEEIQARGRVFMAQLMARPEQEIAVVTHSSFVHYLLTNYGHTASTHVQGDLHRWFENAELRSVVVADPGSTAHPPDPTHFPGFASRVLEGPQA
ncbi:hypothetical protein Rsub_07218 [Raphidocelis subcapitata]|uniref:Phosphoglycerate mutase n=1 Tax=Raphidocelis subcapitata TaxID=307507 RepID=A0A2V0P3G5_9CHLO|nr:hypothetical protein Rsub_07218 [Raphidocelis subcapitata]|eukprot:GBF94404.1 hypothetical protein Rsub_07218 [Raphidocelis subcapitata]